MTQTFVILAASTIIVAGQEKVPLRITAGETVEICGIVIGSGEGPERCDASLAVSRGDETFTIVVPASLRRSAPGQVRQLRGADVCVKGVVELRQVGVAVRVADLSTIRIVKAASTADAPASEALDPCEVELISPRVLQEVKPPYTAEAMRARIEGVVGLEAVVLPTGMVGLVRVTKSLDSGLDEQAVKALRQWKFAAGTRLGVPVPVLVSVEMSFAVRKRR